VGAGFSFTEDSRGFAKNEEEVATNLHRALVQFFELFPDQQHNDFYVTGESYAGKYVPATAYKIHEMNMEKKLINLKGISIGDGAMDPVSQFTGYSDFLFHIGLADELQVARIKKYEEAIIEGIAQGELRKAFLAFDEFLNGDFYPYPTYFFNITGSNEYFNLLNPIYPPNPYGEFLNLEATRNAIHVGNYPYFDYNSTTERHLIEDWMRSIGPLLPTLLENYKVLMYNGQLDIILGPAMAEKFIRTIPWSGSSKYEKAERKIWFADSTLAGYVREVGEFRQVVVLAAGHMVPLDQPKSAYDMIHRFVRGTPFK